MGKPLPLEWNGGGASMSESNVCARRIKLQVVGV